MVPYSLIPLQDKMFLKEDHKLDFDGRSTLFSSEMFVAITAWLVWLHVIMAPSH